MIYRICPACKEKAYSAAAEQDWICPVCGCLITKGEQNGTETNDDQ